MEVRQKSEGGGLALKNAKEQNRVDELRGLGNPGYGPGQQETKGWQVRLDGQGKVLKGKRQLKGCNGREKRVGE